MASAVVNKNFQQEEASSYEDLFPSLPSDVSNGAGNGSVNGTFNWNNPPANEKLAIKSRTTTQVFHVPVEERRYKEVEFGNDTHQKCEEISHRYGVKIEVCSSKDQSLHVVISGNEEKVAEAKRAIINALQTETEKKLKVPRELHKFIIGPKGAALKDLQNRTSTNITVPKPEEKSDYITITGTKTGIEQAIHEIQAKSDEQSKTGFERLQIPKLYHPWIRGPNNSTMQQIMDTLGVKINIPPFDIERDEITVTGDKEKVDIAVAQLQKIFNDKQKLRIKKFEIQIPKSQHKLIIGKNGSTVQEIFKDYDIYVFVPRSESNSETVTLYGEDMKVGAAMTQVYAKANSVITEKLTAPSWLHRYIIGEKGTNISKITADYPSTHVNFEQDDNKITIEGPPYEISKIRDVLTNIVNELQKVMTFEEIKVDQKYIGHLVGKSYENVTRMKNDYGVHIRVPNDTTSGQTQIRIEGAHDGVKKAKNEMTELLKRVENERSKDIIIDQKYHSTIIGQGGKNIAEIRSKFNDINISIPNAKEKSDVVTVRGNKNDVENCVKHLQKLVKDLEESNYKEEIHIYKKFHKMIIGKHGASIRKIRDETNTRIDVPQDNSESDTIQIIGKKENVVKARKLIEDKVKELINIEEDTVEIPHNLHNALIGRHGAIIKQIRNDCGGVQINFPPENKPSDKIQLKGPREEIEKAKQELLKLAKNKNELSYSEDIHAKSEYHRYLVGRNGNNVNQLREKYGVRIIFPQHDSSAAATTTTATNGDAAGDNARKGECITIIGKEENVKKVKEELEATIKNLEEQINDEVEVDQKWHKNFTARRGKIVNKISDDHCGVKISFPKVDANSDKVKLKGPKEAVAAAKKKILEVVYELENQVTIEVSVPHRYHNAIIGRKGVNSQQISEDYRVELQFPAKIDDRENENNSGDLNDSNEKDQQQQGSPSKLDIVIISGLKEDCEKAKEAILALVPIQENYEFPNEFHKNLLVKKAEILKDMSNNHNVQVIVPRKEEANASYITLIGTKENIAAAKEVLQEKLKEYEAGKHDRELRNFVVEVDIKPEYIPALRGKNGTELEKLGEQFDCRINLSKKGEPDRVIIRGYENKANEAKEEILKRIEKLESKISQEIEVDARVHPRIIGAKGKALAKICDKYKVNIVFPNRGNSSDVLIVQGDNAELVDDCVEHLKNLEEEYLQDITDRHQYQHPSSRQEEPKQANHNPKGFVVRGAPWEQSAVEAPDTTNMLDFPTIAASNTSAPTTSKSWGPSKK